MNTDKCELTGRELAAIRETIAHTKEEYLKSPTYVEIDEHKDLRELPTKRLHANWWDEFTGNCDCLGWRTYYDDLESALMELLDERPEEERVDSFDVAGELVLGILKEYAIPGTEKLGDLFEEVVPSRQAH